MDWLIYRVAALVRGSRKAWQRKGAFLSLLVLVFAGSTGLLARLDLLPEPVSVLAGVQDTRAPGTPLGGAEAKDPALQVESPEMIVIPTIGLTASIENPVSTDIAILDKALLAGAVRYPTSAKLGEDGNVVLFGHSSYLPIVHNQAFKTFDGIQDLEVGEEITVYGATRVYTYAVRSVAKESAESGVIPLAVSGRLLTLSTCDSFGEKSDRFVVVAELVRDVPKNP